MFNNIYSMILNNIDFMIFDNILIMLKHDYGKITQNLPSGDTNF